MTVSSTGKKVSDADLFENSYVHIPSMLFCIRRWRVMKSVALAQRADVAWTDTSRYRPIVPCEAC